MTSKYIDMAYPTSPNAVEFGFPDDGCWVVIVITPNEKGRTFGKAVAGFKTLKEAHEHANTLPQPWHPVFSTYYPLNAEVSR